MIEKTIIINGKPFKYIDESSSISYDNEVILTEQTARDLIVLSQKLFKNIGLDIFLTFGTLLGAVREGGLIKWDSDVDVYVEDEEVLLNNLQYLSDNGLKLCRIIKHQCYSFKTDVGSPAYIDVYIRHSCKKYSIWAFGNCRLNNNVTPKHYFENGTQEVDFCGIKCKCVKNPENLLAFWYGENWRVPVKGHANFIYEIPLAHFVHTFPKRFIKTIIGYNLWKPIVKPDGKNWWFKTNKSK